MSTSHPQVWKMQQSTSELKTPNMNDVQDDPGFGSCPCSCLTPLAVILSRKPHEISPNKTTGEFYLLVYFSFSVPRHNKRENVVFTSANLVAVGEEKWLQTLATLHKCNQHAHKYTHSRGKQLNLHLFYAMLGAAILFLPSRSFWLLTTEVSGWLCGPMLSIISHSALLLASYPKAVNQNRRIPPERSRVLEAPWAPWFSPARGVVVVPVGKLLETEQEEEKKLCHPTRGQMTTMYWPADWSNNTLWDVQRWSSVCLSMCSICPAYCLFWSRLML